MHANASMPTFQDFNSAQRKGFLNCGIDSRRGSSRRRGYRRLCSVCRTGIRSAILRRCFSEIMLINPIVLFYQWISWFLVLFRISHWCVFIYSSLHQTNRVTHDRLVHRASIDTDSTSRRDKTRLIGHDRTGQSGSTVCCWCWFARCRVVVEVDE